MGLERLTYRTADHVISTNESYSAIADRRGRRARDVTVVRSGPDPEQLQRGPSSPEPQPRPAYLAAYIGIMGPQDGVDHVLRAADVIVHELAQRTTSPRCSASVTASRS